MKIAITGHTSGIGLSLFERLTEAGHNVVGYSRTNGFDLSDPRTIPEIVRQSADCNVFINNAFCGYAQVELLYALFGLWRSHSRTIVNISSNSGDGIKNFAHKYAVVKAALDKATQQLNNVGDSKCRVVSLRPGWVRTPRVSDRVTEPMLSVEDISSIVIWLLALPPHVHLQMLTLVARSPSHSSDLPKPESNL